jgi:hypothetical protein
VWCRLAIACACLAGSGCDKLLGLHDVPSGDAGQCVYSVDDTGDEDCDGLADGSDPCPADAIAPYDADSDSDGIGDACDPSNVRNHVALFDAFASPSAGWTGAAWTFAGGALVDDSGDGRISHSIVASVPLLAETYVELGTASAANPYVDLEIVPGTGSTIGCRVAMSGTGAMILVLPAGTSTASLSGTGRLRIVAILNAQGLTCEASFPDQAPASATGAGVMLTAKAVQLAIGGTTASFDSAMVVSGP